MPTVAAKRAREHSSETSSKERQEVEKTTEKEKKIESVHDPVNECSPGVKQLQELVLLQW